MSEQTTQTVVIEVTRQIAEEILWTRFYAQKAQDANKKLGSLPDAWAFADGRTKQAKAYKSAEKEYDRNIQEWRKWAERLGHRISNIECDTEVLVGIENS